MPGALIGLGIALLVVGSVLGGCALWWVWSAVARPKFESSPRKKTRVSWEADDVVRLSMGCDRVYSWTVDVPPEWPGVIELSGEPRPHRWLVMFHAGGRILPRSRAEPVLDLPSTQHPAGSELTDIVDAHRDLLRAYVIVAERARQLPRLVRPPKVAIGMATLRTMLCWRFVVRAQLATHFRRQLEHLAQSYLRSQLTLGEGDEQMTERREVLAKLRGECQDLATMLPSHRGSIVRATVAVITALQVGAILIKTPQFQLGHAASILTYSLLALVFIPGPLALAGYLGAFRCKRALLAGGAAGGARHQPIGEIYSLEDRVFDALGRRKRLEPLADARAYLVALGAWAVYAAAQFARGGSFEGGAEGQGVVILVAFVLVWVWKLVRGRRRSPR